jgi:hypothetical protein
MPVCEIAPPVVASPCRPASRAGGADDVDDVGRAAALRDQRRAPVDQRVVDVTRLFVPGVPGREDGAGERGPQFLEQHGSDRTPPDGRLRSRDSSTTCNDVQRVGLREARRPPALRHADGRLSNRHQTVTPELDATDGSRRQGRLPGTDA